MAGTPGHVYSLSLTADPRLRSVSADGFGSASGRGGFRSASAGPVSASIWMYVTDGGHYENLGLVEALRRGADNIVVLDASGDKADTWFHTRHRHRTGQGRRGRGHHA